MMLKVVIFALSATLCAAVLNGPNIFRPCNFKNLNCIRSTIRSRASCGSTAGSPPSVFISQDSRFDAPAFNASYVDKSLVVTGLNRCYVSEFYINRQSKVNVLAVTCPNLLVESDRIMYQHYPAEEDRIFRYFINSTYPLITFTTPFYRTERLDICQEFSNAHVHALPIHNISPYDRLTQNHLTRDLSALNTFERETFAARANMLTRAIVNHLLCNFGCA